MIPLSDSEKATKFPFWVIVIIAINAYIFFLELTSPNPDAFIAQYALIPAQLNFHDPHTLTTVITSQFLHGGFLHIISNMLFFWVFGDNIESYFGHYFFPIFYLISGIVAGVTQYLFLPTSLVPMIGASGAIAGVLGAYFALYQHSKVKTLIPIFGFFTIVDVPAFLMLIYWFFTQILAGAFSITATSLDNGGIAYFAHIGGFIFGFLVAKAWPKSEINPEVNN